MGTESTKPGSATSQISKSQSTSTLISSKTKNDPPKQEKLEALSKPKKAVFEFKQKTKEEHPKEDDGLSLALVPVSNKP